MISDRKDYLERLMEQLQELFQAIFGLGGNVPAAQEKIREASHSLFGVPYDVLLGFDAATLVHMLGRPAKVNAAARIMAAEADILLSSGDPAAARQRFQQASGLVTQLTRTSQAVDEELVQTLRSLDQRLSAPRP